MYLIKTRLSTPYGLIPSTFNFRLEEGYTVLVGRNNSGKSTLLQLVFKSLFQDGEIKKDRFCFIERNRYYIQSTTQPKSTLVEYNRELFSVCSNQPKDLESQRGPNPNSLCTLLLHKSDFVAQIQKINEYLVRLGFNKIILRAQQNVMVDNILITKHGAGIRCVLPILGALTSSDIKIIIIDEPELSLEARSQKVLKQFLLEGVKAGKIIIIATQSHLFSNNKDEKKNYIVSKINNSFEIRRLSNREELLNLTYNLLGNSLQDLFFPSNFLIVEGASDQVVCEKVASLLNITTESVKIISAKGIDNISDSYKAIENTLIPLISSRSPYSKKVTVMIDKPMIPTTRSRVSEIKRSLQDRCFVLNQATIEEYIPESIYQKAGRNRDDDLLKIKEIKEEIKHSKEKAEGIRKLWVIKKEISSKIAEILSIEDLEQIPIIKEAVEMASNKIELT